MSSAPRRRHTRSRPTDASNAPRPIILLPLCSRLQVEHGVTELIFGVDLVEAMLRQGDGKTRSGKGGGMDMMMLKGLKPTGSAIQCRVCAFAAHSNQDRAALRTARALTF